MKQPDFVTKDIERGKAAVCSFITTHLDEHYYTLVKNSTDPKVLLQQVDKAPDPVSTLTIYSLYRQFGYLYYEPNKEIAIEFIMTFTCLVNNIRRCSEMTV